MAGVMSPEVRMGTLVGAHCSMVAIGVLLGAMLVGRMMLFNVSSELESESVMRPGSEEKEAEIEELESVIRPGREPKDPDGDERESAESAESSEGNNSTGETGDNVFCVFTTRRERV